MKKRFDLRVLSVLGAAVLSFAACGDDEETFSQPPSLPELGVSRPVTAIRTNTSVHGGSEALFQYDEEGRMTGGTDFRGDFKISFQPLGFEIVGSYYTDTWKNIRTNSRGNIVSATVEERDDYDEETYSYPLSASYDADGRLTRLTVSGREEGVAYTYGWTLEYKDGNLVRMVEEDAEPGYKYTATCEYEYGTPGARPNSGVSFFTEEDIIFIEQFQWYGGYWGLPSAEMPLRCERTISEVEDGEETYSSSQTTTYAVTYDSDNRVRTLSFSGGVNSGEQLTFTYGDEFVGSAEPAASAVRPVSAGVQSKAGKSLRERLRARRVAWKR